MPIVVDIRFRAHTAERPRNARKIARVFFRSFRIPSEALRKRAEAFKFDQPGDQRAQIGHRLIKTIDTVGANDFVVVLDEFGRIEP